MANEDYEILPHQLLQDLKGEVEQLKKKLTHPDAKANELILEIESLKDSVHELHAVFQKALDDAKGEEIGITIKTLREKVENVVSQNETIAKALIAISDKIDEFMNVHEAKTARGPPMQSAPSQHSFGIPPMPGPARTAPPPMMQMPQGMNVSMPPPPMPSKRKGIFQ